MKLANKDKFINDMTKLYRDANWNPQDVHFSLLDVKANLDSPEYEVDAIPKEWIKKWLTKQTIPALHTCDYYEAVDMMLDDWEKENE